MCTSRARWIPLAWALCGIAAAACTSDEWPPFEVPEEATTEEDDEDDEIFAGARLEILEPASPSIHPLGEPVHLHAQVVDAAGLSLDVDDAQWVQGALPLLPGLEGDVSLPPGVYELSAVTRLPGGDRLQAAVGGVRVQARWTGEYLGDLTLSIEGALPNGSPLFLQCVGPLRMSVSLDGRDVQVDDGTCVIDVFGQTINGSYGIDVVVYDAGLVRGTVFFAFDSPFGEFELPLEWAGAFFDDQFGGGLDGNIDLPLLGSGVVDGSLAAVLIDPYVDPDEG